MIGGNVSILETLSLKSVAVEHWDAVLQNREQIVHHALEQKHRELLLEIAAVDKENLQYLIQKKEELSLQLHQLNQVKAYSEHGI